LVRPPVPAHDFARCRPRNTERLEHHTSLDRLEARGTLRLAFKLAGLEPKSVTSDQLRVLFERVLPDEFGTRGVGDAASVCSAVMDDVAGSPVTRDEPESASVDDVFRRLGGG
jgi:hypothetical protein